MSDEEGGVYLTGFRPRGIRARQRRRMTCRLQQAIVRVRTNTEPRTMEMMYFTELSGSVKRF
jgi:hypothetical protein